MNDRDPDLHFDSEPPEDSGDDRAWNESFLDLVERIERGDFPIDIPFAIDVPIHRLSPSPKSNPTGDKPSLPPFPTLRGVMRLDQGKIRDMLLDAMAEADAQGQSVLPGLTLLARVDRNAFLDTAAAHFAKAMGAGDEQVRGDDTLGSFIVDANEHDPDALSEIVKRTASANRLAGRRLRDLLLETVQDPPCRDELGFLAVAALVERLEKS